MRNEFAFIGLLLLVTLGLNSVILFVARLIRPAKPNPIKAETYECGIEVVGNAWVQFKAQYYIYALVFVIFDIEAAFLFPWAVAFGQLPLFAIVEMVIFLLILLAALIYVWRKGDLEWV